MARITNEETLAIVPNKYELSMLASQRVRDLNGGMEPIIKKENDKLEVIALREIASGKLDIDHLRSEIEASFKKNFSQNDSVDKETEEENTDIQAIDAELTSNE